MLSFSLDFAFEIDLRPSTAVELMRFRILFSMFRLNFLLNGSSRSDWSVVLALSLSELSSSEDEDVAFVLFSTKVTVCLLEENLVNSSLRVSLMRCTDTIHGLVNFCILLMFEAGFGLSFALSSNNCSKSISSSSEEMCGLLRSGMLS